MSVKLQDFFVEIVAVLAILVGVALLFFEPSVLFSIWRLIARFSDALFNSFEGTPYADYTGFAIITLAGALLLYRIRLRFLKSELWRSKSCPVCGSSLARIHRTQMDRLVERLLLPHARRYSCMSPTCHWTGLRHKNFHERRLSRAEGKLLEESKTGQVQ